MQGRGDNSSVNEKPAGQGLLYGEEASQELVAQSILEKLMRGKVDGYPTDGADDASNNLASVVDTPTAATLNAPNASQATDRDKTSIVHNDDEVSATSGASREAPAQESLTAIDSKKLPVHHKLHNDTLKLHEEIGVSKKDARLDYDTKGAGKADLVAG